MISDTMDAISLLATGPGMVKEVAEDLAQEDREAPSVEVCLLCELRQVVQPLSLGHKQGSHVGF